MTNNIITPKFRAAYISVFRATKPRGADPDAKAKFSIRACFPPDTDMTQLKAEAAMAAKEKWGDRIPKMLRSPFRRNDELENPIPGIGDDWVIMTFNANEDRRPGLVDMSNQDILDESEVYAGAWYRAQIRAFAYDASGNKGVSFALLNVQKLRDDEPIGSARIPASKVFEPVAVGDAKSAESLFD